VSAPTGTNYRYNYRLTIQVLIQGKKKGGRKTPQTLYLKHPLEYFRFYFPYTLMRKPYTLMRKPYAFMRKPYAFMRKPYAFMRKPYTYLCVKADMPIFVAQRFSV
jgi:hypothetical protein